MIVDAHTKPLLAALRGEVRHPPPLWLMRQAGRYLPEYRALRARAGSFLDLCYDPASAAEASLQPLKRFDLDGVILFSDILVVAEALGVKLWFQEGEGPCLEPIREGETLPVFDEGRQRRHLAPVYEAMERVVAAAPAGATVLGFAGAPWTLATYMVGGGKSRDFMVVKGWAYRDPESFARLIETVQEAVAAHLIAQLDAGAEAVQIFDSWAGALPESEFQRWSVEPVAKIVAAVKAVHPAAPVIGYPRGAGIAYQSVSRRDDRRGCGLHRQYGGAGLGRSEIATAMHGTGQPRSRGFGRGRRCAVPCRQRHSGCARARTLRVQPRRRRGASDPA